MQLFHYAVFSDMHPARSGCCCLFCLCRVFSDSVRVARWALWNNSWAVAVAAVSDGSSSGGKGWVLDESSLYNKGQCVLWGSKEEDCLSSPVG
jgi:hypothetical protein